MSKAARSFFIRKPKAALYNGKGEEFKYWQRYLNREMDKVRGPEIKRIFVGYKRRQDYEWYYDEDRPNTSSSHYKQGLNTKMPLVKPIKKWDIFLGDKVEVMVGRDKGKVGEVVEIIKERNWCFVGGLHLETKKIDGSGSYKTHLTSSPTYLPVEKPLLVTHEVKLVDPSDLRATDFEWRYTDQGERVRVSLRSGRIIPISQSHKYTWEDFTKGWKYQPSRKDTSAKIIEEVRYEAKECSFEEDIAEIHGIKLKKRDKSRSFWY